MAITTINIKPDEIYRKFEAIARLQANRAEGELLLSKCRTITHLGSRPRYRGSDIIALLEETAAPQEVSA